MQATVPRISYPRRRLAITAIVAMIFSVVVGIGGQGVAKADTTPILYGSSWLTANGGGVNLCGASTDPTCGGQTHVGGYSGDWYQCVELTQRLYQAKGWHSGIWYLPDSGNPAYDIYNYATVNGLQPHPNNGSYLPVPGDMVVLQATSSFPSGHVVIVDYISGSQVHTVQQNAPTATAIYTLGSGNVLQQPSGYAPIAGVVHSPDDQYTNTVSSSGSPVSQQPVSATIDSSGLVELYGVNILIDGTQNPNVFESSETTTTPGDPWAGTNAMSGYITSISAITHQDGRIELFGVNTYIPGSTANVFHRWQASPGGSWNDWQPIGGASFTNVSAVLRSDGLVELFGVNTLISGSNPDVYYASETTTSPGGEWTGDWASLPGAWFSNISAVAHTDGRLELFGVNTQLPGTTPNLFHMWQTSANGGWTGTQQLSGAWFSSVSTILRSDGLIEVFGVNTAASGAYPNLYYNSETTITQGGGWTSNWEVINGAWFSNISAVRHNDGHMEIFGVNTQSSRANPDLYHLWQTSPNGSWTATQGLAGWFG